VVAAENEVNRKTVRLWRERFLSQGVQGLWVIATGRGRKATYCVFRRNGAPIPVQVGQRRGKRRWLGL
jgi:hypothetical protein